MKRAIDLIVIGGSVGALAPLLEIVQALPADVSAPIAVVIHMPARPSVLPEILARLTTRRVQEAEDKEPLAAHTIYVAPPNYHMLVERTRAIALSVDDPVHFSRPSIDVLFESAADALGERVVGLLLSGSNEDGATGLVRIEHAGGVAIAQRDAEFPEMPDAARRRLGDRVKMLAVPEVAPCLAAMFRADSEVM